MKITSPYKELVPCLQSEGTVLFFDTCYTTQGDLEVYPRIDMTSHHHWNPHQIRFPKTKYGVEEEIEGRNIAAASMCFSGEVSIDIEKGDYEKFSHAEKGLIHDIDDFNRKRIASVCVTEESALKTGI